MSTEEKNSKVPEIEGKEQTPRVTVSMKKLVAGVGTVFAGVLQMLEALEPQMAEQLVNTAFQGSGENRPETTDDAVEKVAGSAEAVKTCDMAEAAVVEEPEKVEPETQQTTPSQAQTLIPTVTVDDITRIIVRKVKQDRSNNDKIGSILKTYGVARVSELPAAKYEAFLTDISQL